MIGRTNFYGFNEFVTRKKTLFLRLLMDYFPLDLKNKGCKSTKINEPFLWWDNRIRCRQLSGMHQPPYELLFVHMDDIHCISASWRWEDGSKEPCLGWYKWSKKYEKRTIDWGSPIAHWTSHQDLSALHLRKNVNSFIFIRFFYILKIGYQCLGQKFCFQEGIL